MSKETEITVRHLDAIAIIDIAGNLDISCAYRLKDVVTRVAGGTHEGVIINMGAVPYLDSSGIGVLVYANSLYRSNGTRLCIAGVTGSPRQVLELTKLTGFLPLSEDEASAIRDVRTQSPAR